MPPIRRMGANREPFLRSDGVSYPMGYETLGPL